MPAKSELTGKKFGKLLVQSEAGRQSGKVLWKCICDCGNETLSTSGNLNFGVSSSCGKCKVTHGMSSTNFYSVWAQMVYRCTNPTAPNWEYYGGRGIGVCADWLNFENFYRDMYPTYQEGLSIDRVDNDSGYCKENCRWTTRDIQTRNMRKRKSNTLSTYRNVSYDRRCSKYVARVLCPDGTTKYLGYHTTELEAALAVDKYIIENNIPNILNFKGETNGFSNNQFPLN